MSMTDHLAVKRDGATLVLPSMLAWAMFLALLGLVGVGFKAGAVLQDVQNNQEETSRKFDEYRLYQADREKSFQDAIASLRMADERLHAVDASRTEQLHALELRMQRLELESERQKNTRQEATR